MKVKQEAVIAFDNSVKGAIDAFLVSPVGHFPKIARMTDDLKGVIYNGQGEEVLARTNKFESKRKPGQRVIIAEL